MFCNSCGAQIKDGSRFCSKCGAAAKEAPATTLHPVEQPAATQHAQQYVGPTSEAPVATVSAADMPSVGTATVLCVIGCLCGIIWGLYGFSQRSGMKDAIARGDAETAKKKFNHIMIATIIGAAVNVLIIVGNMS